MTFFFANTYNAKFNREICGDYDSVVASNDEMILIKEVL